MVFSNIQSLVSRAGLPALHSALEALRKAECRLRDYSTLMELRQVLENKRTEVESGAAKICRLEGRDRAVEKNCEPLPLALVLVNELTAEGALLATRTEKAKVERDILAFRICKLGEDAATRPGELAVVVRAVRSLKGRMAAGEDRAS